MDRFDSSGQQQAMMSPVLVFLVASAASVAVLVLGARLALLGVPRSRRWAPSDPGGPHIERERPTAPDATTWSPSPSMWLARAVSITCWMIVAAVLLRIASGGGDLGGLWYVLTTEPIVLVALGALVLVVAFIAVVALIQDRPWAWQASRFGAPISIATSLLFLLDGHESALVWDAAGMVAWLIAVGVIANAARSTA